MTMKTLELTDDDMSYIKILSESIKTQDNRITSHPIFLVQVVSTRLTSDSNDFEREVWMDDDWDEVDEDKSAELQELDDNWQDIPDGYTKMYEVETWRDVQPFLTEKGAQLYIDNNSHNLNRPRIYVSSAYRNYEWQMMRKLVQTVAEQIKV